MHKPTAVISLAALLLGRATGIMWQERVNYVAELMKLCGKKMQILRHNEAHLVTVLLYYFVIFTQVTTVLAKVSLNL